MDAAEPSDHDLERAEALLDLGRVDEALDLARRTALADPSSARAEVIVAACHLRREESERAVHHAARAAALAPEWAEPHRVRCLALLAMGHRREAEAAAVRTVQLVPFSPSAHTVHAIALTEQERRSDEAWAAMERALELAPDDPSVRINASYVAARIGRWAVAEEHAQAALALHPDDPTALQNLGVALAKRGRPGAALGYLAASARAEPSGSAAESARRVAHELDGGVSMRTAHLAVYGALVGTIALTVVSPTLGRIGVLLAAGAGAVLLLRHRAEVRRRRAELPEDVRHLVERAHVEPPMEFVAMLWVVLGVSALMGLLFAVQLLAPGLGDGPPPEPGDVISVLEGEDEPNRAVAAGVLIVSIVAGGWAGHRLDEIRRAREE